MIRHEGRTVKKGSSLLIAKRCSLHNQSYQLKSNIVTALGHIEIENLYALLN